MTIDEALEWANLEEEVLFDMPDETVEALKNLAAEVRRLQSELGRYYEDGRKMKIEADRYREAITQYLKGMDSCCCEACQMFRQALRGGEE